MEKMTDAEENSYRVIRSNPKRNDIPKITDTKLRELLHVNQKGKCANPYCTSKNLRAIDYELDHKIARSRGGADGWENRIGLCANCNRRKSAKAWGEFLMEEGNNRIKEEINVKNHMLAKLFLKLIKMF